MTTRRMGWAVLLLLGTGCATTLKVSGWRPAPVPVGAARSLQVIRFVGTESGRERVVRQLVTQARAGGHFTAQDRSEDGATQGGGDVLALSLELVDLRATSNAALKDTTEHGVKTERLEGYFVGTAGLRISAADPSGREVLSKRYDGRVEAGTEEDALEGAAKMAVFAFLTEVSPVQVDRYVKLDEDDDGQRDLLESAKRGELERAIEGLEAYSARAPENASAHYNLGLLLEAQGAYARALEHFQRAARASGKPLHRDAATACERRLAEQQAGSTP